MLAGFANDGNLDLTAFRPCLKENGVLPFLRHAVALALDNPTSQHSSRCWGWNVLPLTLARRNIRGTCSLPCAL